MNRILYIRDEESARKELSKINVSSGGIESMSGKMDGLCIKLENVQLPAANILKQEMLSLGGDAAVARGVVNGQVPISDVILMGNSVKLKRLTAKLDYQKYFGLPDIKADILKLLKNPLGRYIKKITTNGRTIEFNKPAIMGILNITPDSFSDGEQYFHKDKALKHALLMIEQGADIIDIGGESTRPGAKEVNAEEEIRRVIPVLKDIRKETEAVISVDTRKSEVAEIALKEGADVINDISACRTDKAMIDLLADNREAGVILMHMQGNPGNMQDKPYYDDVIREVTDFLAERVKTLTSGGIENSRIILDPGIGFGKRQTDNLSILQRLREFHCLQCPILIGASRKSFLGRIDGSLVNERLAGSLAAAAQSVFHGAHIIRVHDVKETQQLVSTLTAVWDE